jgi:hypothetical protein
LKQWPNQISVLEDGASNQVQQIIGQNFFLKFILDQLVTLLRCHRFKQELVINSVFFYVSIWIKFYQIKKKKCFSIYFKYFDNISHSLLSVMNGKCYVKERNFIITHENICFWRILQATLRVVSDLSEWNTKLNVITVLTKAYF